MNDEIKLPFGKYKTCQLSEIPTDYLDWLIGQDWLKSELTQQITDHLNTRSDWHQKDNED